MRMAPPLSRQEFGRYSKTTTLKIPRQVFIGLLLITALVAFETFNFDTTEYALANLLGDVRFAGIQWATILAIAFCAIDFAGLARIFTPEKGLDEPREIQYLTAAWLLGATLNALMTWWAVSLTLLNHDFGNEVLSRQQLLHAAPIFVAVLVWLTRILFIGAMSVAGDHIFQSERDATADNRREASVSPQPTAAATNANMRAATLSPNDGPSHRERQSQEVVADSLTTQVAPVPRRDTDFGRTGPNRPRPRRRPAYSSGGFQPQPAASMQSQDGWDNMIEH